MIKKREFSFTKLNKCDRKVLDRYTKLLFDSSTNNNNSFEENRIVIKL